MSQVERCISNFGTDDSITDLNYFPASTSHSDENSQKQKTFGK